MKHDSAGRGGGAIVDLDLASLGGDLTRIAQSLHERLSVLPDEGVLEATLACDPAPLLPSLEARGARARCQPLGRGRWRVELRPRASSPEILDVRDLEAPEPLQRILEAAAGLAPGEALLARTPRYPHALLIQLERRALAWEALEEPDGSGLVLVRRPA